MNEEQFANIINSTKKIVLSAVSRHLDQDLYHVIDDVAQETYIRVYNSLVKNQFMQKSKLETWIYTIAKNEALRMNSKYMREKNLHRELTVNADINKSHEIEDSDKKDLVENKIFNLPSKYSSVFKLYINGLNEKKISEELSISTGTVKSRLHRGKKLLLKLFLKERGNDE